MNECGLLCWTLLLHTDWCKVGIGICYDLRFSEMASIYALRGRALHMGSVFLAYMDTWWLHRLQAIAVSWSLQHNHWPTALGTAHSWTVSLPLSPLYPMECEDCGCDSSPAGLPTTRCLLLGYLLPGTSLPPTMPGATLLSATPGLCVCVLAQQWQMLMSALSGFVSQMSFTVGLHEVLVSPLHYLFQMIWVCQRDSFIYCRPLYSHNAM